MAAAFTRLGLIAGGGDLPVRIAEHCRDAGLGLWVNRIDGMADARLDAFEGVTNGIAQLGKAIEGFKRAGCDAVAFAGYVARPDFKALKPDLRGAMALPRVIAAAGKGDDALLQALIGEFERDGLKVIGVDMVLADLVGGDGVQGAHGPDAAARADLAKAGHIAAAIGALDIGQGAVVVDGLVLAVEAQEGTQAMLERVATLPQDLRGRAGARKGVLVKRPKPGQDLRIDLPTIGPSTVQATAAAGLAGIGYAAGAAQLTDRDAVLDIADAAGLFVIGLPADAFEAQ